MTSVLQNHKPVILFPEIYDLSDFVSNKHPVNLHPEDPAYLQYWTAWERKFVEGIWGKDMSNGKGGWRYMPSQLAWYGNASNIRLQIGDRKKVDFPQISDIEWIMGYDWCVCRGFSGCEDDPENTCFAPIGKIQRGEELTEKDKYFLYEMNDGKYLKKKNGSWKTFIEPLEYLHKTHPEAMGLALFHNEAQDNCLFGSRSGGKTYWQANAVSIHEYKFFGATRYNSDYFNAVKEQRGQKVFTRSSIEKNINDIINATRISLQFQENNLGSYKQGRVFRPGFFHRSAVGVLQGNNVKNPYSQSIQLKVRNEEEENGNDSFSWITLESGASLNYAIATPNNPAPGTGGRYTVMVNDEIGRNPNLRKGRDQEKDCMIMNFKNGSDSMTGTSGELENVDDALFIFNNPIENDVLAHDDNFEYTGHKIGRFLPTYYVDRKFKDELGNTDVLRAFKAEMEERQKLIDLGAIEKYNARKLNRPVVPSEMIGGGEDFYLPREMAIKRKVYLDKTKIHLQKRQIGEFIHPDNDKQRVEWVSKPNLQIIMEHEPQRKSASTYGGVEIYEFPPPNLPPRRYWNNLYKVILDPIKDDGPGTKDALPSLLAAAVHKGFAADSLDPKSEIDNIVATAVLRRDEVEAGVIIAFQFALFYNAYLLFEGNVGPIMTVARMNNWEHLLQPTPYASLKTISRGANAKWGYGVVINSAESLWAEGKFNEWLKRKWKINEDGVQQYNIDKLYWYFLLDQIGKYKRGKNFDAISCMKVLMFWLHQEEISPVEALPEAAQNTVEKIYNEIKQVDPYDTTFIYGLESLTETDFY